MPVYEGSLYELIRRERQEEGDAGPDGGHAAWAAATDRMMFQILGALDFVHTQKKPIIHRDIKPANILYQGDKFLLTDFGIAKVVDMSTTIVGTEWYMAPEVPFSGEQTTKVDIFGLGATVSECLVKLPLERERLSRWPTWTVWHQELRAVLDKHAPHYASMVAHDARHRSSARELLDTYFSRQAQDPPQAPQANVGGAGSGSSKNQTNKGKAVCPPPPSVMDWTRTAAKVVSPQPEQECSTRRRSTQAGPSRQPAQAGPSRQPAQAGSSHQPVQAEQSRPLVLAGPSRQGSVRPASFNNRGNGDHRRNRSQSWRGAMLAGVRKRSSGRRPGSSHKRTQDGKGKDRAC